MSKLIDAFLEKVKRHCFIKELNYNYNFLLPAIIGYLHAVYLPMLKVICNIIPILLLHNSY